MASQGRPGTPPPDFAGRGWPAASAARSDAVGVAAPGPPDDAPPDGVTVAEGLDVMDGDAAGVDGDAAVTDGVLFEGDWLEGDWLAAALLEGAWVEGAWVEGARVEGAWVEGARVGAGARREGRKPSNPFMACALGSTGAAAQKRL